MTPCPATSAPAAAATGPASPVRVMPRTAYWIWLDEGRAGFEDELRDVPEGPARLTAVARLAGERWKAIPAQERARYELRAAREEKQAQQAGAVAPASVVDRKHSASNGTAAAASQQPHPQKRDAFTTPQRPTAKRPSTTAADGATTGHLVDLGPTGASATKAKPVAGRKRTASKGTTAPDATCSPSQQTQPPTCDDLTTPPAGDGATEGKPVARRKPASNKDTTAAAATGSPSQTPQPPRDALTTPQRRTAKRTPTAAADAATTAPLVAHGPAGASATKAKPAVGRKRAASKGTPAPTATSSPSQQPQPPTSEDVTTPPVVAAATEAKPVARRERAASKCITAPAATSSPSQQPQPPTRDDLATPQRPTMKRPRTAAAGAATAAPVVVRDLAGAVSTDAKTAAGRKRTASKGTAAAAATSSPSQQLQPPRDVATPQHPTTRRPRNGAAGVGTTAPAAARRPACAGATKAKPMAGRRRTASKGTATTAASGSPSEQPQPSPRDDLATPQHPTARRPRTAAACDATTDPIVASDPVGAGATKAKPVVGRKRTASKGTTAPAATCSPSRQPQPPTCDDLATPLAGDGATEAKPVVRRKRTASKDTTAATATSTPSQQPQPARDDLATPQRPAAKRPRTAAAGADTTPPAVACSLAGAGSTKAMSSGLDEAVLAKAEGLGLAAQLRNLAVREVVAKAGLKPAELLAALQEHGGLVNKAKDALLLGS